MIRKLLLLFSPVLLYSFAVVFNQPAGLVQKLEDYLAFYTPEKVYLHTDKPYYSAGDTIWFAAYLAHGVSHMATAPSRIVYVELINEKKEVLARRDLGIDQGTGAGEFALADTLAGGKYLLRGYTSFMRNFEQAYFFHKELRIAGSNNPDSLTITAAELSTHQNDTTSFKVSELVSVQFFPEGGELVGGIWSTVGVKLTGPDGKGVEASGIVANSRGEKVADWVTSNLGMGRFRIYPTAGESYKAFVVVGSQMIEKPFPDIKPAGYVLTVSGLSQENVAVRVEGTQTAKGGYLVAHVRGQVFLTLQAGAEKLEALLPKKDLPEGIATFTWFDDEGRPQCERLVFIEHGAQGSELQISGLNASYKRRDKVSIDLHSAKQSVLSVAVTDKAKIYHQSGSENIKSYLLLNSDLRGEIEDAGYYFDKQNKSRLQDLDDLLLTQGWRRFTWKDVIEDRRPEISHLAEPEGFSIAGRVVDFYNGKKPVSGKITLTATGLRGGILMEEMDTDSLGYFLFTSLYLPDTTNIVLQTPNVRKIEKKGAKKEFVEGGKVNLATRIILIENKSPEVVFPFEGSGLVEEKLFFEEFLKEMKQIRDIEKAYSLDEVQILEEIEVRGRALRYENKGRFEKPGTNWYGHPSTRADIDSLTSDGNHGYISVFDVMVGRFTGFRLIGTWPNYNIYIYGARDKNGRPAYPIYLYNGAPIELRLVNQLPVDLVDFIDIVRPEQTQGMYYNPGGIVAVYGKSNYIPPSTGVSGFMLSGYYQAREFYSPDYDTKKESHARTDVRPTLYWKAGLKSAEGAPAKLEFYTSDVASTFEIRIEGITEDGRPFVKREEFVVN